MLVTFLVTRPGGQTIVKKTCVSVETSGRGFLKNKRENFKISTHREFQYNIKTPGVVTVKTFIDSELTKHTFSLKKMKPATT